MITIAVANVLESSEQAVKFIQDMSLKQGIKTWSISPKDTILYKNNKKIRLKEYMDELAKEEAIDMLIMQLNKEALAKQVYENINFDIAVLFNANVHNKRMAYNKAYLSRKLMKDIQSSYYIIPETCKCQSEGHITYGWGQSANISASSAQKSLEGETSVQCCIQTMLPSFKGGMRIPREFCVQSHLDNVEGMLAGIATMLLYGINIEDNLS